MLACVKGNPFLLQLSEGRWFRNALPVQETHFSAFIFVPHINGNRWSCLLYSEILQCVCTMHMNAQISVQSISFFEWTKTYLHVNLKTDSLLNSVFVVEPMEHHFHCTLVRKVGMKVKVGAPREWHNSMIRQFQKHHLGTRCYVIVL